MYAEGRGVPRDETKAVECYQKAATQGNELAQLSLGNMYLEGKGVTKDDVRAYAWYSLLIRQLNGWHSSHPRNPNPNLTLNHTGIMIKNTSKIKKKTATCLIARVIATALHNNAAKEHQDGLEKQMTPPQKAAAQKLTTDFFSRMPKQQFQCAISLSGLGRMRDATDGRAQGTPLQSRVKNFHLHAFSRRRSFLRCLQRSPQAHLPNCSGKKRGN